jgi:hypothetical protein
LIRVRGQKKQDFWPGLRLRALKSNDLKIKVFKYFNLPPAPAKNLAFLPPRLGFGFPANTCRQHANLNI